MIDLIIFDCDGVLADTEPITTGVLCEMMRELGAPLDDADTAGFSGPAMSVVLERMAERLGRPLPETFLDEYRIRSYERMRTSVRPEPGLLEALASLRLPICIGSNGPREKVEIVVNACGNSPLRLARIHSAYELGVWKPDPEFFHQIAIAHSVEARCCAVVEDSAVGATAATRAGMHTILYDPPMSVWPELRGGAEFGDRLRPLRHFDELPGLLAELVTPESRVDEPRLLDAQDEEPPDPQRANPERSAGWCRQ